MKETTKDGESKMEAAQRVVSDLIKKIPNGLNVEIHVVKRGLGSVSVVAKGKYGEEIRIPSATEKYEIQWVPKTGLPVVMLKDFG